MKLGSFSTAVKLIRQSYKLHAPSSESDKESLLENLKLGNNSTSTKNINNFYLTFHLYIAIANAILSKIK